MTILRVIECNGCDELFLEPGEGATEVRLSAKREGWIWLKNKPNLRPTYVDLCPECAPQGLGAVE